MRHLGRSKTQRNKDQTLILYPYFNFFSLFCPKVTTFFTPKL